MIAEDLEQFNFTVMAKKLHKEVKRIWESKIKQTPSKLTHISYSSISTFNKCPSYGNNNIYVKLYLLNRTYIHVLVLLCTRLFKSG